jgi:hypothetical protein
MRRLLRASIVTSIAGLVIVMAANAASERATIVAHAITNSAGQTVLTWRTAHGYAVAIKGTNDSAVVSGHSLTYWSEGQRREVIRFHDGGLQRALSVRFGVTKKIVDHAIAFAPTVTIRSPFVRRPSDALSRIPAVLTTVEDYGVDAAKLAKAFPFAIRFAGPAILDKKLAHVYIATVANPFTGGPYRSPTVSGPIVTIVYSSAPAHLGAGDHQLTLTFTSDTTQSGRANATFLGGGRESIKANGITAYKANENQIVFRVGHVIAVLTSTVQPSDTQWQAIVSALRTP